MSSIDSRTELRGRERYPWMVVRTRLSKCGDPGRRACLHASQKQGGAVLGFRMMHYATQTAAFRRVARPAHGLRLRHILAGQDKSPLTCRRKIRPPRLLQLSGTGGTSTTARSVTEGCSSRLASVRPLTRMRSSITVSICRSVVRDLRSALKA